MELIIKTSAAALTAIIVGLVIKKTNPEMAFLLSACTVCIMLLAAARLMQGITALEETVRSLYKADGTFVAPVMKCLGISIVTKLSCELCRESSHPAAASALETVGTVCALTVAMPIIQNMLKMIGGMI